MSQGLVLWGSSGSAQKHSEACGCQVHPQESAKGKRIHAGEWDCSITQVSDKKKDWLIKLHVFFVYIFLVIRVQWNFTEIFCFYLSLCFLHRVNHENIVSLEETFETPTKLYLVMTLWVDLSVKNENIVVKNCLVS